jgi:hypothetical protein
MEFAPDAAFAADEVDQPAADAYLSKHGLVEGHFICVLSRLRYTPYFRILNRPARPDEQERHQISEIHKESDHEGLRLFIIHWVRSTGLRVLLCPEMTYEVELTWDQLYSKLPEDIRHYVIWRDRYWRPDEATAVYARARAVVSMEMHSPILASAVNTPAIYLRLPTDTCKGQMWRDLGLPEWIFEVEEIAPERLAQGIVAALTEDPEKLAARFSHARDRIQHLQARSMHTLKETVLRRMKNNTRSPHSLQSVSI